MKLLRTIRLDSSDTFIFPSAAEPGEWAVSGVFTFCDADTGNLEGKRRAAFRSGFFGVPSRGWSTLAQIVEATSDDHAAAIEVLARCLCDHFGAPDLAVARRAAEQEVAFAATLCNHPADTLIAVHRHYEGQAVRESFRTLRSRPDPQPSRGLAFLEVEGARDPDHPVDLAALAGGERL